MYILYSILCVDAGSTPVVGGIANGSTSVPDLEVETLNWPYKPTKTGIKACFSGCCLFLDQVIDEVLLPGFRKTVTYSVA